MARYSFDRKGGGWGWKGGSEGETYSSKGRFSWHYWRWHIRLPKGQEFVLVRGLLPIVLSPLHSPRTWLLILLENVINRVITGLRWDLFKGDASLDGSRIEYQRCVFHRHQQNITPSVYDRKRFARQEENVGLQHSRMCSHNRIERHQNPPVFLHSRDNRVCHVLEGGVHPNTTLTQHWVPSMVGIAARNPHVLASYVCSQAWTGVSGTQRMWSQFSSSKLPL